MTRSAGAPAAVSIRIIAGSSDLVMMRQSCVAVDAGEVAVEHDDVVGVDVELCSGLVAVVGDVDGDSLVAQALGDPVRVAAARPRRPGLSCRSGWRRVGVAAAGSVIWTQPALCAGVELERCRRARRRRRRRSRGPSPWPFCEPVRSAPKRLNGWASCATAAWSSSGPLLSTTSSRRLSVGLECDVDEPCGWLWRTAFSITLSTIRASSVALPATSTGARVRSYLEPLGGDLVAPRRERVDRRSAPATTWSYSSPACRSGRARA